MKIVGKADVVAQVTITGEEAALIAGVAGGEFIKWYKETYGDRYGSSALPDEIEKALESIRRQCRRIVNAVEGANSLLREATK